MADSQWYPLILWLISNVEYITAIIASPLLLNNNPASPFYRETAIENNYFIERTIIFHNLN